MLLYAITNRHLLSGENPVAPPFTRTGVPADRSSSVVWLSEGWDQALINLASQWSARNIDYIQIREKDLSLNDLRTLTEQIVSAVREHGTHTKVLLNGPAEIAFESGADGIHLTTNAPSSAASEARSLFARSGREAAISRSCHSITEVLRVREESQRDPHSTTANTLILYAPVFEKVLTPQTPDHPPEKIPGQGLESLRAAVHAAGNIPVIALGGVTNENASSCLAAGASGIAGIRLFLPGQSKSMRSY